MFDISLLKDMKLTELQEIAKSVDIKKYRAMKKDVLIENIMRLQTAEIKKESKPEAISKPIVEQQQDNKLKRKRIPNPEITESVEKPSEVISQQINQTTENIEAVSEKVVKDEVVPRNKVSNRNLNDRNNQKNKNSNVKKTNSNQNKTVNTTDSVSIPTETKEYFNSDESSVHI